MTRLTAGVQQTLLGAKCVSLPPYPVQFLIGIQREIDA
jgi:hypothetical protein